MYENTRWPELNCVLCPYFYAEYELVTLALEYSDAGHSPPIVVCPRSWPYGILHPKSSGMSLSRMADLQFAANPFPLEMTDILVACADANNEVEINPGNSGGQNSSKIFCTRVVTKSFPHVRRNETCPT